MNIIVQVGILLVDPETIHLRNYVKLMIIVASRPVLSAIVSVTPGIMSSNLDIINN